MNFKLNKYQVRMVEEASDLAIKLHKLSDFIGSKKFRKIGDDDKCAMQDQFEAMSSYLDVLKSRIGRAVTKSHARAKLGMKQ